MARRNALINKGAKQKKCSGRVGSQKKQGVKRKKIGGWFGSPKNIGGESCIWNTLGGEEGCVWC